MGFADACIAIGQMFEKGEDLPKNLESAATWYQKAAEHGYGEAQLDLAALYINSSDYKQARSWCETAAKEKLAGAYYCLGYLYQHGSGVDPNPKQAFGFYEQAARGGNISSMRALARMYENGDGTKPDHVQALNWYLLAAERGNQNAVADLKRMRSSMTDKEWKDTEKKLLPNLDRKRVDSFLQGTN